MRAGRVVRRREPTERLELSDEVALIDEPLGERELGPGAVLASLDRSEGAVEPHDPCEALGARAHPGGEAAAKSGRSHPQRPSGVSDPLASAEARDGRSEDAIVDVTIDLANERAFDHGEHAIVALRFERPLPKASCLPAPELAQIELTVPKLVRGHTAEEGPRATRTKGDPSDVALLARVDRAGASAEPDHADPTEAGHVAPPRAAVGPQRILVQVHQELERWAGEDPLERVVVLSPVDPDGDHEGRERSAPRPGHDRHSGSIARARADSCDARRMQLTHDELLALAASARVLMEADGEISEGETELARNMGAELGVDDLRWERLWDEAIRTIPDREALTRVASVTRPVAREQIYEQLYVLATDGTIVDPEWDILEWLDEVWRALDEG